MIDWEGCDKIINEWLRRLRYDNKWLTEIIAII